ncbi:MAG TPA: alpha/beta hydrolase [Candidatus Kryptonia bacterium]|nr:alpha/beta hydrolase [Candidatus Kryptonia bacterium]
MSQERQATNAIPQHPEVPRHDVPLGGRSGFTVIDGRQVHYLEWGPASAPVVLCLHGGGQTAYMFEEIGHALRERYHVLAPDLPDHGDSDPAREYGRHAIAATLPALCAHFGLRRFAMIGASLGGIVSITHAAAHPDGVSAIVLIDVGHKLEEQGVKKIMQFMSAHESFASLEEAAAEIAPYLPHRKNVRPERLSRNLRQRADGRWVWKHGYNRRLRAEGDEPGRNWQNVIEGLDADCARLRCPVLVLRGAASDVLSREGAEEVAKLIPNARLATVHNAGHLAAGDNPESTVSLVSGFLAEIGW